MKTREEYGTPYSVSEAELVYEKHKGRMDPYHHEIIGFLLGRLKEFDRQEREPAVGGPCVVDLTRDDEYPDGIVPDADFETCLKVLRTVKNVLVNPPRFRPSESMTLVKAHSTLVALCEEVQRNERAERAEGNNG